MIATLRILATFGGATAAAGSIVLLAIGQQDHWLENYFAQFALLAVFLAVFVWMASSSQPSNAVVWVMALTSALAGLGVAGSSVVAGLFPGDWSTLYVAAPDELPLEAARILMFTDTAFTTALFMLMTLGLLLFPNGRLPSNRWLWVSVLDVSAVAGIMAFWMWSRRPESPLGPNDSSLVGDLVFIASALASLLSASSLLFRLALSSGETRQQLKWITWGGSIFGLAFVASGFLVDTRFDELVAPVWTLALITFLISYGVAITKHRLYDIDIVISRTLVYGMLAAFIGAVYAVVVLVLGGLLGWGTANLPLSIAATALVAIAFEPLRQRLQHWANRIVYGTRSTPYEILSNLAGRLAGTEPTKGLLTRMARLMAEGTGADQATVWLADGKSRLSPAAGWPAVPPAHEPMAPNDLSGHSYPVLHDDRLVGVLEVTKPRTDPLTPTDRRLMADLAGSAGLVMGNQRLNDALVARAADLQESRRRLVEAQDDERRRLERDLHDGAQQEVVALKLKIALAERIARKADAGELADLLGNLAEEAQEAVDEIRRIAKGLYPPLLDSEDLAAAIRAQAATYPVRVEVEGDHLGRHGPNVESAAYFAAVEAIANATNHGKASEVWIELSAPNTELELIVRDDGIGFDTRTTPHGVGLMDIRDRVEALGGVLDLSSEPGEGTVVSVTIPLQRHPEGQKELDPSVVAQEVPV